MFVIILLLFTFFFALNHLQLCLFQLNDLSNAYVNFFLKFIQLINFVRNGLSPGFNWIVAEHETFSAVASCF